MMPVAFNSLPLSFPITRRSDGATINVSRELHYSEEEMDEKIYSDCTCFLVLDKAYVGMMNFAIHDSSIDINFLRSERTDIYSGIGTQMVKIALKCAQLISKKRVEVYSISTAAGFYHKLGFRINWEKYERRDDGQKREIQECFSRALAGKLNCLCFYMFISC